MYKKPLNLEMLKAFVTLAKCLNITQSAQLLSVTRQTIRRHIDEFERLREEPLFLLDNRQYQLTDFGRASLEEAEDIVSKAEALSGHNNGHVYARNIDGLETLTFTDEEGKIHRSQQHSISSLWTTGLPLLQQLFEAWGSAKTQLEHSSLSAIRPFLVVYRKSQKGWVCVEIGDQSAYSRWFGWSWAKSAVGLLSEEDAAGADINNFVSSAYLRIFREGGIRYDHLYAHLPRPDSSVPEPASFQRLLCGFVFPDGHPALVVLVVISRNVLIEYVTQEELAQVSKSYCMDDITL